MASLELKKLVGDSAAVTHADDHGVDLKGGKRQVWSSSSARRAAANRRCLRLMLPGWKTPPAAICCSTANASTTSAPPIAQPRDGIPEETTRCIHAR